MHALEFDHVSFSYDGERAVLDDVRLAIEAGAFTCVLGANGSGKSTLARIACGLLAPNEGTVRVFGRDASDPDHARAARADVGLVFQNPDDQLVASVVENDVAFGPENLGVPRDELRERVSRALATVGLSGFEQRETSALSGGQKQRVAIAGALAMRPRVLVLDEATAMLDPQGRDEIVRLCGQLRDEGVTVVLITHFMDEAAQADRVVALDGGRVRLDGRPADALSRTDDLRALRLDVPFAAALGRELADRGVNVRPTVSESDVEEELCRLRSNR